MKIDIPDDFFPAPGEPLSTVAQRDLAVLLHRTGQRCVEWRRGQEHVWHQSSDIPADAAPSQYRLALFSPRRGTLRMTDTWSSKGSWFRPDDSIDVRAAKWMRANDVKAAEVEFIVNITEIQE